MKRVKNAEGRVKAGTKKGTASQSKRTEQKEKKGTRKEQVTSQVHNGRRRKKYFPYGYRFDEKKLASRLVCAGKAFAYENGTGLVLKKSNEQGNIRVEGASYHQEEFFALFFYFCHEARLFCISYSKRYAERLWRDMTNTSIYQDIAKRTGGDIYIGVVGPVRTGKSTFIQKFMEELVLPNITGGYDRERAKDGMPQSAAGKTVMTTEPKFIPDEAVPIVIDGVAGLSVKMVDCVGYLVNGALGQTENGKDRMVKTPWSQEPVPFAKAAEVGTKKVITDHATIGILVTTDGSITEIPRTDYEEAERRVASELSLLGKPFVVLLNSAHPEYPETQNLARELESRYDVPVALVNALELNGEDIRHILELVLLEFPVREIRMELPEWISALDDSHPILEDLYNRALEAASHLQKVGQIRQVLTAFEGGPYLEKADLTSIDLGSGGGNIRILAKDRLYYQVLSDLTGFTISDQEELIRLLCQLAKVKGKYDRISSALDDVEEKGYGVVVPSLTDMVLEEPKIVKHSGGYGVLVKASAPSIHMIKATLQTEISPVVGTEQQSEDLVAYLVEELEENPERIWSTNLFGKTLYELVSEGLHAKLDNLPEDAREKLGETLSHIINEGSGGLICIIL
jgi:stage IV sporulation protein A